MDEETVSVTDEPARHRYVLTVGNEPAGELVYRSLQHAALPTRVLVHTGIEAAFNGRGLGSQLIAAVLADCRDRGLAVLPRCPFVKAYLGRHPDDLDIVPAGERAAYGLPPA